MQGAGGQIAELTTRGRAAAIALARQLGLPSEQPAILSNRGNLVVHLAPAPVVARVATLTARTRRDPLAWLAREVAVAAYVAARGGPAVAPAADAGPYWQDGLAISLWEYVPSLDADPGPADVGAALARLHCAARDCTADLAVLSPATDQVSDGLAMLERDSAIDPHTLATLRSVHAHVLAELAAAGGESTVLHGDAHRGNLLASGSGGLLWIDLEETCRGPAAWDLATMVSHYAPTDGQRALRAYASETRTEVPSPAALAPFRHARDLEAAVWSLCMAQLYPARYRDVARSLLAIVLDR